MNINSKQYVVFICLALWIAIAILVHCITKMEVCFIVLLSFFPMIICAALLAYFEDK